MTISNHDYLSFTKTEVFGEVSIDYRCEDGRYPLSAVNWVTISNPISLSSESETVVNSGIRS
jgi:hypothetical protein